MTEAHYTPPNISRAPKQARRPASVSKPKRINPTKQRKLVETAIERLLQLLDEIDPDPDLEEENDAEPQGDEEPTMGWCNPTTGFLPGSVEDWTLDQRDPGMDQTSLQVDNRDGEFEPSLGWAEGMVQSPTRIGSTTDRELDTADQEASLGWQNEGSQGALRASRDDCEEQCEDEGAQDDRELDAQGFTNPDSAQYNTPRWQEHMHREFGE